MVWSETCDRPRPTQGLPGPSGLEPLKSPKRVRKEYPGAGPQKCPKSAPRSLERVRKESKSQILDSFRTLSRLGAHSLGTFGALPRGTLSGLFSDSSGVPGPKGPRDPVWGGADRNRRLKITSTSTERQKRSQNLAPVVVIISGNSLVFSRK